MPNLVMLEVEMTGMSEPQYLEDRLRVRAGNEVLVLEQWCGCGSVRHKDILASVLRIKMTELITQAE